MAGRNGIAALPRARPPIVLKRSTITYEVECSDGQTVPFVVYVKGPGCPLPVLIAIDEALAEVEENEPTDEDRELLSSRRYLAKLNYAERTLRRSMLNAIAVEPLALDDVNLLAADGGAWKDILIEAGWRQSDEAIEARQDTPDPEVMGEASLPTGAPASPDSSQPIQATTP